MPKKNKSTPTATPAAATAPATVQLASTTSLVQPPSSKPKTKKKKEPQVPVAAKKGKQAQALQNAVQRVPKSAKPVSAASTSNTASQTPMKNVMTALSPTQSGKGIGKLETPDQTRSEVTASTSKHVVASVPSSVVKTSLPDGSSHSKTPHQDPEAQNSSISDAKSRESNMDEAIFRLAAATPVPISPIIERQFYESQLLLYVLEKVRGEHKKRQNYHGELDQDETELRRSFVDKLAYICDFKKGGSTVTALALQKTYQGVIFWLAANDTVKSKVIDFLGQVLQLLKKVEAGASSKTTERQLLALIVPFNEERLDYYWSALLKYLPLCIERLEVLESSNNGKPTQRELKVLKNLLGSLPELSKERVDLVKECFQARKMLALETLAQLTGSGKPHSTFFEDIRHLLGRLGEHVKATKTIVSAALRFPGIFDEFEIKARVSPPSSCYFRSPHDVILDGMAGRIFTKEEDVQHYQEALETLERTSNGALVGRLQQECLFKTRVHAELLLVDLFYWHRFEFLDDDPYIGCSKPACFNCYQYILVHPGNFVLPACHNKLYLAWRTPDILEPDILEENVSISIAIKIREAITRKMTSSTRAELKRQIDGRYARKGWQYDSVTGTSSSIQGVVIKSLTIESTEEEDSTHGSAQEDLPSRRDSPLRHLNNINSEQDDSDNDLSWYQSRLQKIQLL